jgi:hypothetical protein
MIIIIIIIIMIIFKNKYFFRFSDGEGRHGQPAMKCRLILSLIPKQNVVISTGTLHCDVNLCTTYYFTVVTEQGKE